MNSYNQQPPFLGQSTPTYPVLIEAVRVTTGTVPGPSGYASSSALGPNLYIGFVQQLNPTTLLPRDRIPCFVDDLNRQGLAPGYYTNARLSGSYQSLPVYTVGGSSSSVVSNALIQASGVLTPAQVESLSTLTPSQIGVLGNLTPCQLQTLVTTLPLSQIQTLTLSLTPAQLTNFVSLSSSTQLLNLYNQLTTSQVRVLSNTLNLNQVNDLVTVLTPAQILTLTTGLTSTQFQSLVEYPPATVATLVTAVSSGKITLANLISILNTNPLPSNPVDIGVIQTSTFTSGTNNNVPVYGSILQVPTTGSTTITGFVPFSTSSAQKIKVANTGTSTLSLSNQSSSSSSGNQIKTSTGSAISVAANSSVELTYNPNTGFWGDTAASIATSSSSSTGTEGTLAATGSVQGDAALITTNRVDVTGADGTKGVILPNNVAETIVVNNAAASGLKIYPPSGAQLGNTGGANNPTTLTTASMVFYRISSTLWAKTASLT